ncbi:hypothetical protein M408DRAFT_311717, partial [Serendipita vermifera MAFF 305830]
MINSHRFETAFFVDGGSTETIKRDLIQHVRSLGGAHSQKSFNEAIQFLSRPTPDGERLLVIDNVDDPKVNISLFLPKWKRGTVILTSRNASHGQLGPSSHLKLDVMSTDESTELFTLGSKGILQATQDRESAVAVAEEMGYLPIALVQAASYIFRTKCSAEAYISLLRTSRERLLSDPATSQIDMRYTTAFAAFDASYTTLPHNARQLLHLLSFLHRQKFPVKCFGFDASNGFAFENSYLDRGGDHNHGIDCLKDIFYSNGKWDPAEVNSIVESLLSHSLITLLPTTETRLLQIHSLVHEWARICVPNDDVERFQGAAIRLVCCSAQKSNYSMMQYLQAHVQALSSVWERLHANDLAAFSFILAEPGAYSESLGLRERLLSTLENHLEVNHPSRIVASINLAATYSELGRYTEAEVLQVQILKQRMKFLGVGHLDTTLAAENLAFTYSELGRYTDAEELQLELLDQRKILLGIDHF